MDYLVDEVLDQQPTALRRFLLDTSVLDRLCGPLCDAVTEGSGGRGTLETLERRNLLLIPLDDQRHWYRYHHLFADVLLARLLDERPEDLPALHRRASAWYEQAGHLEPAVRHAFAAGDVALAADLVEIAAPETASAPSRGDASQLDGPDPAGGARAASGTGQPLHRRAHGQQRFPARCAPASR